MRGAALGPVGDARYAARRRPAVGSEKGQATVEFALVLPFLVVLMLAVLQVALLARDYVAVVHAARAAAREASLDSGREKAAAATVLDGAEVDVGPRGEVGDPIRVTVRYTARTEVPIVGALFPQPELTSSTVMRIER